MIKVVSFLPLSLLGVVTLGFATPKAARAESVQARDGSTVTHYSISTDEATYIDFITGFTSNSTPTKDLAKFRNATFWDKYRYNGLDYFCDTILTNGGESGDVTLTSCEFNQNGQPYVCFTMGGGNNSNIYMSLQAKVNEEWVELSKTYNNYFADPLVSMQMVYRVVEVPEDYRNNTLRAQFVDAAGNEGGFRLLTFGAFNGACSLNAAAKLFNIYKEALITPANNEDVTNSTNAINTILNTSTEYSDVRTAAASLGGVYDISEGFEEDKGFPTFTEDYLFNVTDGESEEATRRFNSFTNQLRNDASTYWVENIPFNKTGDYFFDSDKLPGGESSRARYFSTVFTLSGSGVISFKMAGESAKFSLWDAEDYSELIQVHGHDGIFLDGGVRPIDTVNGRRTGTMQRIVVDASKYLGKKVFIDIEDDRTGGGWGLARFDEIITYYPTAPSFKIDSFYHNYDGDNFNAVNYDIFKTTETDGNSDMASAYSFLQTYYSTMRDANNGYSRCGVDTSSLLTAYNALSAAAKDIVDNSDDYCYANRLPGGNTSEPAYASSIVKSTVGEAIANINPSVLHSSYGFFNSVNNQPTNYVVLNIMAATLLIGVVICLKKKKAR